MIPGAELARVDPRQARSAAAELARFPGTLAQVAGTSAEVTAMLTAAHAAGRLVHMTPPRPMPGGWVAVDVRLRPLAAPRWTLRRGRLVAVTLAVALIGAAAVWLVQWVAAHLATILAVAAIVGLLWAAAGRAGACPGIHCPGCKCAR